MDSVTQLNSNQIPLGHPVVIMYFDPGCVHCQDETKSIVANIDSLKNVQIYLLTPMPYKELMGFYNTFHLSRYKNITVGIETEHTFYEAFKPTGIPYLAIYNSQKKLIKIYKGGAEINAIFEAVKI
jgi:hypothetical protein